MGCQGGPGEVDETEVSDKGAPSCDMCTKACASRLACVLSCARAGECVHAMGTETCGGLVWCALGHVSHLGARW